MDGVAVAYTRQPQDCVYGEGKEGERQDNVTDA
jgi:hypothetical protein